MSVNHQRDEEARPQLPSLAERGLRGSQRRRPSGRTDAAPRRAPGPLPPSSSRGAIAVYLSDFAPSGGAECLMRQAALVGPLRAARAGRVAFYVDSGREDGIPAPGPAMVRLIADLRPRGIEAVHVENVGRLGPTPELAQLIERRLLHARVAVVEAVAVNASPRATATRGRPERSA